MITKVKSTMSQKQHNLYTERNILKSKRQHSIQMEKRKFLLKKEMIMSSEESPIDPNESLNHSKKIMSRIRENKICPGIGVPGQSSETNSQVAKILVEPCWYNEPESCLPNKIGVLYIVSFPYLSCFQTLYPYLPTYKV